MAIEFNNLGDFLLAIGRQIASAGRSPVRADRPERDLPILLLPNPALGQTSSDRKRTEQLPYLLESREPVRRDPPPIDEITARRAAIRLPRKEGSYPKLDAGPLRTSA